LHNHLSFFTGLTSNNSTYHTHNKHSNQPSILSKTTGAMTELTFARAFLTALDSRPITISADHVEDPRSFPSNRPAVRVSLLTNFMSASLYPKEKKHERRK